ncbi:MAG: recombinase family protein [Oscillospiraceae bacterium]|nr:recombinase family protein [Oscillospiraceae bacterium]
MTTEKLRIAYTRLSRDDEQQGESNSITNQKALLEEYAQKHGYTGLTFLVDDGWSGTRWDRPGIVKLMEEIERGNVELLLTKDMSRLGRDHLRVGLMLEQFREQGVRFIAVNDGVDSNNGIDDFTPFRNIINEFVARDTSRKIRAINESRTKNGKHVTGAIPYGYIHDSEDRQKWLLDEEAAPIVKRIYQSIIEGKGVQKIADELTSERVLIPAAHWQKINAGMKKSFSDPYRWSMCTVAHILRKEEYMGWTVLNKTVKETYKSKRKENAPENRLIFKDSHPQIIDEETWSVVQRLRNTKRKPKRFDGEPNPLTGVLFCSDCGHKLYNKLGDTGRKKVHNEYVCSSYRHYTRSCTMHYIRTEVIEDLILTAIRRVCRYVRENEKIFIERVRETSVLQQAESVKASRRKLSQVTRRRDEVGVLIKKLYESYALDKIPEKHFTELLSGYDSEQTKLDGEVAELQSAIDSYNTDSVKADKFIELVKRHTDFTEFSAVLLNEFVEKVIVHEAVKVDSKRTQDIEIFFSFIGKFDAPALPEEFEIVEEIAVKRKRKKKLRRCEMSPEQAEREKERDRVRYAKKKAARVAAERAVRVEILQGTSYEETV